VHLSFDEAAIFDAYELNRTTGAFILIDPDTNNTVAGGMIAGKRGDLGGLNNEAERVILSLPADLADKILASGLLSERRDEIDIRRTNPGRAAELLGELDS
jgi:sulfate adenylyltransferase subunit 1